MKKLPIQNAFIGVIISLFLNIPLSLSAQPTPAENYSNIAVLPFKIKTSVFLKKTPTTEDIDLRKIFYQNLSIARYRDIELYKIDALLPELGQGVKEGEPTVDDLNLLRRKLGADYVITGEGVIDIKNLGFTSNVKVGLKIKMYHSETGALAGNFEAESNNPEIGFPMTPWEAVFTVYRNIRNTRTDILHMVANTVCYKIIKEIPEPSLKRESPSVIDFMVLREKNRLRLKAGEVLNFCLIGSSGYKAMVTLNGRKIDLSNAKGRTYPGNVSAYSGAYAISERDFEGPLEIKGYLEGTGGDRSPALKARMDYEIDLTPPRAPSGLRNIVYRDRVVLEWESKEPSAGYIIHRCGKEKSHCQVVGESRGKFFVDRFKVSGPDIFYQVSAVDQAGNISKFSSPLKINSPGRNVIEVGGRLKQTLEWAPVEGDYLIREELVIPRGMTLTIKPGTRIMSGGPGLLIEGGLKIMGDEENPVVFTLSDGLIEKRKWEGIFIKNPSDTIMIQNAIFEFSEKAIKATGLSGTEITLIGNTVIRSHSGILISDTDSFSIQGNSFKEIAELCIGINKSKGEIRQNSFEKSSNLQLAVTDSQVFVENNNFTEGNDLGKYALFENMPHDAPPLGPNWWGTLDINKISRGIIGLSGDWKILDAPYPDGKPVLPSAYEFYLAGMMAGNFKKKVEMFKKSISLDPEYLDSRLSLAKACKEKGDWEKALKVYTDAENKWPRAARILKQICAIFLEESKYEDALRYIIKAMDLEPQNPGNFEILALILREVKEYHWAVEAYRRILDMEIPDETRARLKKEIEVVKKMESKAS